MRDVSIEIDDIKHFFCKKNKSEGVVTKRILGITFRYVRPKEYRALCYMLKYLQQYVDEDLSGLLKVFEKSAKKKYPSAKIYQKDLEQMYKILNKIEPSKLPPAVGYIRELQLNTLEFAKEIMQDIKANTDVNIWLDGGTLLGAKRHRGFIPWDDDMDFALLRDDYNKLMEYLAQKYLYIDTSDWVIGEYAKNVKMVLKRYPNKTCVFRNNDAIKCVRGTVDDFCIIDIFAWDFYNDMHNVVTLQKYANNVKEKINSLNTYKELFEMYAEEINKATDVVKDSDTINIGIDNHGFHCYAIKENLRKGDIYPLQKMKFEDWEFYCPHNVNMYLKAIYNNYNKLPECGFTIAEHVNTKGKDI